MSAADLAALEAPVRREQGAMREAAASAAFSAPIGGWTPERGSVEHFAALLDRNLARVEAANDDDARVLALADLNPPRSVLEDHGLLFERFPDLSRAHAAVDGIVARLLEPFT